MPDSQLQQRRAINDSTLPAGTVFRWMGSKRREAATIASLLRRSAPEPSAYYEPFLGGGSVFLSYASSPAHLSDCNPDLINAWTALRDRPLDLQKEVSALPGTRVDYYRQRERDPSLLSDFDRAVRFLYLNRNCFNGLYRTNRKARFNVPYGLRTGDVPSAGTFERCAQVLKYATIRCRDFRETLADVPPGSAVYLDPPFPSERPNFGEYGYGAFTEKTMLEMLAIANDVSSRATVILSLPTTSDHLLDSYDGLYPLHITRRVYSVASRPAHRAIRFETLWVDELTRDVCNDINLAAC